MCAQGSVGPEKAVLTVFACVYGGSEETIRVALERWRILKLF